MLDKQLCKICGVDKVEEFFVDYIDELDDKLEVEIDKAKIAELQNQKEIIQKLRHDYREMVYSD